MKLIFKTGVLGIKVIQGKEITWLYAEDFGCMSLNPTRKEIKQALRKAYKFIKENHNENT